MKLLLGSSAVTLMLALGVTACGDAGKGAGVASASSSSSAAAGETTAKTQPEYNYGKSGYLDFGHAASPTDKRAVTTLVKRYYAAAAAEDGATACSLILPSVARTVAEDYGKAPGPAYMRGGKTCPEVMYRLFAHLHRQLVIEAAELEITRVRLKTRGGYAVLGFGAKPEREITVVHQNGAWTVSSLLDSEL